MPEKKNLQKKSMQQRERNRWNKGIILQIDKNPLMCNMSLGFFADSSVFVRSDDACEANILLLLMSQNAAAVQSSAELWNSAVNSHPQAIVVYDCF